LRRKECDEVPAEAAFLAAEQFPNNSTPPREGVLCVSNDSFNGLLMLGW
jgi:hypothetical protein